MFKKKANKVKVRFEMVALRALNLSPKMNGREVVVSWSKGKRKSNRGESDPVVVQNGTAALDFPFTIDATMYQDPSSQHFESKKIALYLKDDKKSKLGKETIDLAAFAKEGIQATQNLSLGKKNPPILVVSLKASWLKFNGKFILRDSNNATPDAGAVQREVVDIDGHEFQLRTADAVSEADTSCYTNSDSDGEDGLGEDRSDVISLASAASAPTPSTLVSGGPTLSSHKSATRDISARKIRDREVPSSSGKDTSPTKSPTVAGILAAAAAGGSMGSGAILDSTKSLATEGSSRKDDANAEKLRKEFNKLNEKYQKKKAKLDDMKKKLKSANEESARLKEDKGRVEKTLEVHMRAAEDETRRRDKADREIEEYKRKAKEYEEDLKGKGKEVDDLKKRLKDNEEELRKRTKEANESKEKLKEFEEIKDRLKAKEEEARKRTKENEEAEKKIKELKEKVSNLNQHLKDADEARRAKSGVAEEERKRWRDKEEGLAKERDLLESRVRDTDERMRCAEREMEEMRRREREMEEIISRLSEELKTERANAERALEQAKAASSTPSKKAKGKKVEDNTTEGNKTRESGGFDFPVLASGPLIDLTDTPDETFMGSSAPAVPPDDTSRKRGSAKKKQLVKQLEDRLNEAKETIARLKQELEQARDGIEEARRERREAERRMRDEREQERQDEKKDRTRERKELEEQIDKLRSFVEEEKRKQRAVEEKLRKKDKPSKTGSAIAGSWIGESIAEAEKLRADLEAKDRHIAELERQLEAKNQQIEEHQKESVHSSNSSNTTPNTTEEAKKPKKGRKERSSSLLKKSPTKKDGQDDVVGPRYVETQEGEQEQRPAQVSWQEKAMRLKGKLNRIEGQLARERTEKSHISDLLAKREEELTQLQRQIAPLFDQDDEDGGEPASLPQARRGSVSRAPTSVLLSRSTQTPQTALTPFFEWWRDINGRPGGPAGDLNIKMWWIAVGVLLLSTFLQLWWRTEQDDSAEETSY